MFHFRSDTDPDPKHCLYYTYVSASILSVSSTLRYVDGAVLSLTERVIAGPLDPYLSTDISIDMTSPAQPGLYQSKWRMSTATGSFFGDVIWVIIREDFN